MEHRGGIELHSQAITFAQAVALPSQRNVDRAFEYPHLLIHSQAAHASIESHSLARWEMYLDDLHRLRDAGRRDVTTNVARCRVLPLWLVLTSRYRAFRRRVGGRRIE